MLALGPRESSIVKFVRDNKCGLYCYERKEKSLYDIILSFFSDDYLLKSINQNLKTLRRKYNREKFHTKFIKLINN